MPAETTDPPRAIPVKVLSQLPEPDGTILFESLPVTTTVGELKAKIHDRVASRPAVEHQRLIYRGRVMAKETDTLVDVFGRDAVQSNDTRSLHLVIRDGQTSTPTVPRSQTPQAPSLGDDNASGGPTSTPRVAVAQQQIRIQQHVFPGQRVAPHSVYQPQIHAGQPGVPPQLGIYQQQIYAGQPHLANAHAVPQPQMLPAATPQGPFVAPATTGPLPHPPGFTPHAMPRLSDLNNMLQQHMEALQRYQNPNMQAPNTVPQPDGQHTNQPNQPSDPMREFQQRLERLQQQQRDALANGPQAGRDPMTINNETPLNPEQPSVELPQANQDPNRRPISRQGFMGQGIGPNGERMSISVQTSGGPMPFPAFPTTFPPPHLHQPQVVVHNASSLHPGFVATSPPLNMLPGWTGSPPLGTFAGYYGSLHAVASMRRYQEDLDDLTRRIAQQQGHSSEPQRAVADGMFAQWHNLIQTRNRGQEMINSVLARNGVSNEASISSDDIATLQFLNDRFVERSNEALQAIRRIRGGVTAPDASPASSAAPVPGTDSNRTRLRPTPTVSLPSTTNGVTAYLLNSPAGPHAIVYAPLGTFSTPSQYNLALLPAASRLRNEHRNRSTERVDELLHQARHDIVAARQVVDAAPPTPPQAPRQDAAVAVQPAVTDLVQVPRHEEVLDAPVAPIAAAPQAEDGADDAFAMMGPLFRHVWLLIRLFGFIWFFTGGVGSGRTLMIVGAATIWFAIQAGLLGDRVDRLRRHFEGLLGPPNGPAVVQAIGADPVAAGGQAPERQGAGPITPQDTAARLLRERVEADRGWLRQTLRTVEGAVALFIASLYPGVGERHVAAREEQRRQAEARAAEALRASQEARIEEANDPESTIAPKQDSHDGAETPGASEAVDAGEGSSTSAGNHLGSAASDVEEKQS